MYLRVSGVRQIEIHAAKPLVSEPSPVWVEIGIVKLKNYKSSGSDQILAELFQAGGETWSDIRKFIKSFWSKEELPERWMKSVVLAVYKKGDNTDRSNY
jgi:hypothetical protein